MLNRTKVNESLRERLLKDREEHDTSGSNTDPRVLNYFDLDFGQQMEVLLLADDDGELYYEYSSHVPPRGAKLRTINCSYTSSREPCCVCEFGWEVYKRTDNKEQSYKWRRKQHFIGQALPLTVPKGVNLNESEDGNLVKLFYMPWGIKEIIDDALINRTIDDPSNHVLVIKKTKNQGGKASYNKSFFKPEPVVLDKIYEVAAEEGKLTLFNLKAELPAPTTSDEMETWLKTALEGGTTNRFWEKHLPDAESVSQPVLSRDEEPALQTSGESVEKPAKVSLMQRLAEARAGRE